jgi:1-acyl-sn-glycerol-3-phosphate acyltransferase
VIPEPPPAGITPPAPHARMPVKRPPFDSLPRRLFWETGRPVVRALLALGAGVRVSGLGHVPPRGPLLVAANHISHFDPPLVASVFPRPIDWVAMNELYSHGWSRRLFDCLNAIPIRRGAPDRAALREARLRLDAGRVVGIFPEGGLRAGPASILNGTPPRRGAGLLARLTRAPILPCAILGSERLYNRRRWNPLRHRAPVWIAFGPLLPPPPDDNAFATSLVDAFRALRSHLLDSAGATTADLPQPPATRMREP